MLQEIFYSPVDGSNSFKHRAATKNSSRVMSLLNRGAIYKNSHSVMSQSVEHDEDMFAVVFAVFAWLFVFSFRLLLIGLETGKRSNVLYVKACPLFRN